MVFFLKGRQADGIIAVESSLLLVGKLLSGI
jgi:hypothetical protein